MTGKLKRFFYIFLAIIIGLGLFITWYLFYWKGHNQVGLSHQYISYKNLNSRPEAKLYYPNSQLIAPFGQSQKGNDTVAFAGAVLISDEKSDKIYEWYDFWLTSHGWKEDTRAVSGLTDTQLSIKSYKKGKNEIFYVAMNNKQVLAKTLGKSLPENKTVFELRYIVN